VFAVRAYGERPTDNANYLLELGVLFMFFFYLTLILTLTLW